MENELEKEMMYNGMQPQSNGGMNNGMQPPKKQGGFHIGYFFLALLPVVVSFVMQFAIAMVLMIGVMAVDIATGVLNPGDPSAYNVEYINSMTERIGAPSMFGYHILGLLVFGLWYYFSFRKPRPSIKDSAKQLDGFVILGSILAGIALCIFSNGTVIVESVIVPDIVEAYLESAETVGMGVTPLAIFSAVVLAPIGEEFLCRGLTLKFAKKAFNNFWIANVMQALLFGLLHLNWVQGVFAFAIGLVAGWLVENKKSLIPAIILHFVVNFSSSTWVSLLLDSIFGEEMPGIVPGLLMVILPLAVVAGLYCWDRKRLENID